MAKGKPGIFKRIFSWIGKFFTFLRWVINLLVVVVFIAIVTSFLGEEIKPLPEKAALRLVPSGTLVEERSYADPLTQLMEQSEPYDAETPVRDLTEALKNAATDPRITGVVLDLNYLAAGGLSKLAEVGEAISAFKKSGKPVIAVADNYNQQQYYLASFADEIQVNPMGGVLITGFGYYGSYFKTAMDKLKINFHVFRAGEYKSAIEPFTRDSMSPLARENAQSWISELWLDYTTTVEAQRKLKSGTIDDFTHSLPTRLAESDGDLATLALKARLVDAVADRPHMIEALQKRFGSDQDGYLRIDHKDYLRHLRLPLRESPKQEDANPGSSGKIGVVVASGNILDGEQLEGNIGGDSFSRLLQQARSDDSLKALVVRIDSPGGSAFASDLIRREIQEIRKKIPVVVSMGSVAASGGYWIAAEADEIWAQPTTITGSIGVFGIVPTFEESLAALGINSDGVGTSPIADIDHLERPLSEEAAQILQLSIDNIYRQFLSLVAQGRHKTEAEIESIAGGRVWTGRQAADLGLVDKLGNLDDAVAAAAARAGLPHWKVKYIHRPLNFQEQLMKQLAEGTASLRVLIMQNTPGVRSLYNQAQAVYRQMIAVFSGNDPRGAYLQCLRCQEI